MKKTEKIKIPLLLFWYVSGSVLDFLYCSTEFWAQI